MLLPACLQIFRDGFSLRTPISRPQESAKKFLQTLAKKIYCRILPAIAPVGGFYKFNEVRSFL